MIAFHSPGMSAMRVPGTLAMLATLWMAAPTQAGVIITNWVAGRDLALSEGQPNEALNPNSTVPAWSYGYRSALSSSTLTLYTVLEHTNSVAGGSLQGFASSNDVGLLVNTTASDVTLNYGFGNLTSIKPQEILTGPGAQNQFSVLRWTAPSTGNYDVSAYWNDIDPYGGDGASGNVVVNGTAVFAQSFNNGGNTTYSSTLSLTAGDTVDFALGANGAYNFDSTTIGATIIAVPEPSSALMIAGVAMVLGLRRRRR